MANTIATPTWVTYEVARYFVNSLKGVANFNRSYNDEYVQAGAKVGDTVKVRLPQQWEASSGQALVVQNILDQTVNLILNAQRHVGFGWSSAQATTDLDEIRTRYVQPAAETLANAMDKTSLDNVYRDVYNQRGTLGTTSNTALLYLQLGSDLTDFSTPEDGRVAVLHPLGMATLASVSATVFHPSRQVSENWERGQFAANQLGVDKWFQDQNIPRHTSGSATSATPLVNGANQTGSSIVTDGWGTGYALKKGDIVTFGGVYAVNPLSKVSTGQLQKFVLTADVSGTTDATLSISPSIILTGALQTVTASPADNAVITYWGEFSAFTRTATVSPQSLMFHPDAFASVMADLVMPNGGARATRVQSKQLAVSMRYVEQFEITTDQNLNRLDILFGAATIQARLAGRMVG